MNDFYCKWSESIITVNIFGKKLNVWINIKGLEQYL